MSPSVAFTGHQGDVMDRARFPQFYRRTVAERLALLAERGWLNAEAQARLAAGGQVLPVDVADKMVENVIGVFGMPMGLGLNFKINDKDYVIPLVVEEPSIVAALSAAAKTVRQSGGFQTHSAESLLIGQVQLVDVADVSAAQESILAHKGEIINLANSLHPNMVARGGGARDVEVHVHTAPPGHANMLVVHLLVDTCDAMGANLVNTMCEGVASYLGKLTDGRLGLRILSNLADRALVQARCRITPRWLASDGHTGIAVRDGIVMASHFATVDRYRAATHNKGIMNGIDAVALATGNDWRAIEAGAHAYAGRGMGYTALTQWRVADDGALEGSIELPVKVGTVGGNFRANPAVACAHDLLGKPGARELAEVMAAVGLAQNFAALRALATDGIQQGHMTLHARSVVASAGAPPHLFEAVVKALLASGDVKQWRAESLLAEMRAAPVAGPPKATGGQTDEVDPAAHTAVGVGKVLLAGEHAVVYGSHALAVPIPLATRAHVQNAQKKGVHLLIPTWGVEGHLHQNDLQNSLHQSLWLILQRLDLADANIVLTVHADVPRAMGLGGSAALAVAVVRALSQHFTLNLTDEAVIALAFEAEKVAHGTPSGVDNALATLGRPLLFRRGEPPHITPLRVQQDINLVVGLSRTESLTAKTVAQVRKAWQRNAKLYDGIFADIDSLALQAAAAMQAHDLPLLGELMNVNHGLLNALQVSTAELEELVDISRRHGALGAKLTGGGGGGSMVALCGDDPERCVQALQKAGYRAFSTRIRPTDATPL
jgi:hydroxymethylglutaryl-CoA reductase